MSESIYYSNRHLLQRSFVDVISPLVLGEETSDTKDEAAVRSISAWNSDYLMSGIDALTEDEPEQHALGAFFKNERMSQHRREAIALVAGLAVVRRTIAMNDLEVTGLKSFSRRYALGFLSCNITAEFSAMLPGPVDTFLFRTTSGRNNTAQYEALPTLDVLAEQAEECFPLLHDAIERFSRN